ncbi:MAG: prepilin-type N-terminal cleavage/methylation domain-containing protein, partial [Planctomycetota bacterium]
MNKRADTTSARRAAGFTLVELLVVIAIVGLLTGLVLVGFNAARVNAATRSEEASVRAMAFGLQSFRNEVGFLPPLVHDGWAGGVEQGPMTVERPQNNSGGGRWAGSPVDTTIVTPAGNARWVPSAYDPRYEETRWFLRGRDDQGDRFRLPEGFANQRYSKLSLPYYLSGVLGSAVDGVDGSGGADETAMAEPLRSGAFRGVITDESAVTGLTTSRQRLLPFFSPNAADVTLTREYIDAIEYRENGAGPAPSIPAGQSSRFLRTFTGDSGRAFRFYRWEAGGFRQVAGRPADRSIKNALDYNIPSVLLDPVRALRILELEEGKKFSRNVLYIYQKQLEEADFLVINKTDLLDAERLGRLRAGLAAQYPHATVFDISARDEKGLETWFEAVLD